MAEPNYMAYAQYMGARNPLADGINQISGTLSDLQKQGMERENQTRRNSLADLQMRQAQMGIDAAQQDIDYKTGLRSAMQNPRSVTSIAPKQPISPNSLAGIMQNPMMGQQQPFAMPQQEASPIVQAYNEGRVSTQTQTPTQAGAEYAMSQGRIDDVTKLISIDDALAQFGAKIAQGGGNPQEYYKAKAELDQGKEFFEFVKPYMKNPEQLKAMWPLLVKAYPKAAAINPESLKATKDGVAAPVTTPDGQIVPNKMYLYDNEGKMQLIDTTPKAETKGFDTIDLGDKVKVFPRDGSAPYVEKKALTPAQQIRVTTGGGPKAEKDIPTGIQDKISNKLEIYNDWSTLKDKFRPEYMPKTPFKSIGEFQINLNKIFGNNQAAVDWWTQYFDARNIILKERSGAAVMEPEFKRFEQGTIAANTNAQTVANYLDRSTKKYKQHVDGILNANRRNHPESIKSYEQAYGYTSDAPTNPGGNPSSKPSKTASDYLKKWGDK